MSLRRIWPHEGVGKKKNTVIIDMLKAKEIVFRRPGPRLCIMLSPLIETDHVAEIKLLGVISHGVILISSRTYL